jgi:TolB-like protein/Tfp pilus assembly protein PilF
MSSFLQRLKERKLFQWALAYLAGAWLVLQLVEVLGQIFQWSLALQQGITVTLAIGFFLTLVLAWYHGEQGRQRASGAELLMIAALLAIAAILLAILRPEAEAPTTPYAGLAVEGEKPAVAVLPFDNISPNPDDAYFADGMHEEIIGKLSDISALHVTSRTSVMQYRERRLSAREIAGRLGVGFLLEGSARKAEDQVRVTVQLIDASRDRHVWTEEYDRDLTAAHLFEIQSDVAERVAAALEVELTASERARIERHPTESLTAYDLYLLGRHHWNQSTREGLDLAVDYFRRAVEREPEFARAHAGLADSYSHVWVQGWGVPPRETFPQARQAALRALELDSTLAEAHASLAYVRMLYDWEWEDADAGFRRAIELNPNYSPAHHWLALCLSARGRRREAIAEMEHALALDPLSPYLNVNMGWLLYVSRQYTRAAEHLNGALEARPNTAGLHHILGIVYAQDGKLDQAIAHLEEAARLSQNSPFVSFYLGYAYARAGRRDDARRVLGELRELATQQFVPQDYFAVIYLGLGETDEALDWLYQAYEARTDWPVWLPVDPVADPIRDESRFIELVERVGLAEVVR